MRLFVALDVDAGVKEALRRVQGELRRAAGSSIRWVRPEAMHLTLKFLGETGEERLNTIRSALARITGPPLVLDCRKIGFFPGRGRPRIVWAGLEQVRGNLDALQQAVEQSMEEVGFEPEGRKFHPHLTLGRARGGRGERRVVEAAESLGETEFGSFEARDFHLFRSELLPEGARYTKMGTYPLEEEG